MKKIYLKTIYLLKDEFIVYDADLFGSSNYGPNNPDQCPIIHKVNQLAKSFLLHQRAQTCSHQSKTIPSPRVSSISFQLIPDTHNSQGPTTNWTTQTILTGHKIGFFSCSPPKHIFFSFHNLFPNLESKVHIKTLVEVI